MPDPTLTVEYVDRIARAQFKAAWQDAENKACRYGPEGYWVDQFAKMVTAYYADKANVPHA